MEGVDMKFIKEERREKRWVTEMARYDKSRRNLGEFELSILSFFILFNTS